MNRSFLFLSTLLGVLLAPTGAWEAIVSHNFAIAITAATQKIGLSPTTLTFASQNTGTASAARTITATSTGTVAFGLSSVAVSGTNAGDFSQTNNCPPSLAANATCTINVVFTPAATGTRTASVVVSATAGGTYTVALAGTGTTAAPQAALYGVNVSGAEFAPWLGQEFPSAADWAYLHSKGVTFVRLPISWESIQPTLGGSLASTYLNNLENAIAAAHSQGISVIVDLHNFDCYINNASAWATYNASYQYGYAGNGGSKASDVNCFGDGTLTSSLFANVWTQLSTALVGRPGLVGYEIMNEPSNANFIGTNLLFAPNGFGDGIGPQPWVVINGAVVTQLAPGTNPVSGYGPAWSMTSGTGWGGVAQYVNLSAATYSFSCDMRVASGTDKNFLEFGFGGPSTTANLSTTWQRFSVTGTLISTGSTALVIGSGDGSSGFTTQIANCDLRLGSSPASDSTYQPSVWLPYAQAAITAIRAVDPSTPIYVDGLANANAYQWPWLDWELNTLTGGNLVFEAHQYFDGPVSQGGGGGVYTGTFTSYGIATNAGVQEVAPFVSWLQTTGAKGYLGEFGLPNSTADANASWLTLQNLLLQNLIQNGVGATTWFYGSNGTLSGNILNVAPQNGVDDPRLIQMLQQL